MQSLIFGTVKANLQNLPFPGHIKYYTGRLRPFLAAGGVRPFTNARSPRYTFEM